MAYPYDAWLFSGKPIYLKVGDDIREPIEQFISKLRTAAKRRSLAVTVHEVYQPWGCVFQAYIPGELKPILPKIPEET